MNLFASKNTKRQNKINITSLTNLVFFVSLITLIVSCSVTAEEGQVRPGCIDENIADGYQPEYARYICEGEYLVYGNSRSPLDKASDKLEEATNYFDCMAFRDFDPEWEDFCKGLAERVSGPAERSSAPIATQNSQSPKSTVPRTTVTPTTLLMDEKATKACELYKSRMTDIQKYLDMRLEENMLGLYSKNWQYAIAEVMTALGPLGRATQYDADKFSALFAEKGAYGPFGEMYREGDTMMAKFCPDK